MKKDDKASISLKKVISISIILLFVMGVGVMAASSQVTSVKIISADGYETSILTSKTNVAEILEENHIVVLPTENVIPPLNEDISDNNTIKIIQNNESTIVLEEEEPESLSVESVLEDYNSVTEKIVKEKVTIPYETETNDKSTGDGEKIEKVTQNGVDGLKEIAYLMKYENGEEVEKTQIAENLVQEPVNCVKEIRNKPVPVVTSRSSTSIETAAVQSASSSNGSSLADRVDGMTPEVVTMNASAYSADECGGNTATASGARARVYYTIATDPRYYPMGTIIYIPYFADYPNGGWFIAQDTGGAIKGNKIDVFMSNISECNRFGRRNLECYVYKF
ncbi:MAG: G5 domain-containing protein [Clostridia bacterium]|nr:G5 domain-containing protein [Clostridia bacterium]